MIVIVPSRGRPENILALHDAIQETRDSSVKLVIAYDDDDECGDEYAALPAFGIHITRGPRQRLGPTLNKVALSCATSFGDDEIIAFMGDDHRPRTYGWDQIITTTLKDMGTGIVYGNDLVQGEALPTAVFMTSNIIRELGYMSPPTLIHSFLDNYWRDLGNGADCLEYLSAVVIEHCHPIAGTAKSDETYTQAWSLADQDAKAWDEFQQSGGLQADIDKIKALRG